jgi:hypothetical protein
MYANKESERLALTAEKIRRIRHELHQAESGLTRSFADERNAGRRERLEFARAAVLDALRWLDAGAEAVEILAALDEVSVGDMNSMAAERIEIAREFCRPR